MMDCITTAVKTGTMEGNEEEKRGYIDWGWGSVQLGGNLESQREDGKVTGFCLVKKRPFSTEVDLRRRDLNPCAKMYASDTYSRCSSLVDSKKTWPHSSDGDPGVTMSR
jgi:hypothetical protein